MFSSRDRDPRKASDGRCVECALPALRILFSSTNRGPSHGGPMVSELSMRHRRNGIAGHVALGAPSPLAHFYRSAFRILTLRRSMALRTSGRFLPVHAMAGDAGEQMITRRPATARTHGVKMPHDIHVPIRGGGLA